MSSPIHCLSRAVVIDQDHILVCYNPRSTTPYIYLPGGHMEEGESAQGSLEREMLEETTLSFEIGRFLGVLEYSFAAHTKANPCHTHEYNFCFLASCPSLKNLTLPPEPEQDIVRFRWVHLSHLQTENLLPSPLIKLLPQWLSTSLPPFIFSSELI
ncbi:MAG: NUDIX domain-containing protein [Alphaproteobacteria bacterium]